MGAICPICSSVLESILENPFGFDGNEYSCPHCGKFRLTGTLIATLPAMLFENGDAAAKISHALRQAQEGNNHVVFSDNTARAVVKNPLPRPREQADLLLRWLAENVPGPGETAWIQHASHGSIIGSKSPAGFELVLDHLFNAGLVVGNKSKSLQGGDRAYATLSFLGWEYYENLRLGRTVYRKAFMAMKFDDTTLDSVVESVFKPAAKAAGFDLFKLNDVPKAGLIDDRLRVEIQASDFVVADLTHDNFGAYWEAGYAEGLGKPVIYTCEKSKFDQAKTHFDTNHHLTVLWDKKNLAQAGIDLAATIRATLPHLAVLNDS